MTLQIPIPQEEMAAYYRRWRITELVGTRKIPYRISEHLEAL